MTGREAVLQRISAALGPTRTTVVVPRDYRMSGEPDLDRFVERVRHYRATVTRADENALPRVLATLLTGRTVVPAGLPQPWLAHVVVVPDEPPLDVLALDAADAVLTTCAVAVAETGTIVLDAGPGQGRRALSLVPDHHVVVVRSEQVVATVAEALRRLDPRAPQTWISGPSATSDIELIRVEGVHGPRRLDVVVV
jgi:L-lactate dehydrogenase complex protein LldG